MKLLPSAIIAVCFASIILFVHPTCAQEGIVSGQNMGQSASNNKPATSDSSRVSESQRLKTHIVYDSTINKMILVRLPMDSTSVLDTLYTRGVKPDKPINFDYTKVRHRPNTDSPKAPIPSPNDENVFRKPRLPLG